MEGRVLISKIKDPTKLGCGDSLNNGGQDAEYYGAMAMSELLS